MSVRLIEHVVKKNDILTLAATNRSTDTPSLLAEHLTFAVFVGLVLEWYPKTYIANSLNKRND